MAAQDLQEPSVSRVLAEGEGQCLQRHSSTHGLPLPGQRVRQREYLLRVFGHVESTSAEKRALLVAIRDANFFGPSDTQVERLLAALETGPVSTLEARRDLDCYQPSTLVRSLRKRGFNILTSWVFQETECGRIHRVGNYTLLASGQAGANPPAALRPFNGHGETP